MNIASAVIIGNIANAVIIGIFIWEIAEWIMDDDK